MRKGSPLREPAVRCLGLMLGMTLGAGALAGTATVSVGDASVNEGNSGTTTLNVPVTRADDTTSNLVIEYQTDIGDTSPATPGVDYTAAPAGSILRIPVGQTSASIVIPVLGDTVPEADQTLLVQITRAVAFSPAGSFAAPFNYAGGAGPFAIAIGDLDGDGKPEYAAANNTGSSVSVRRSGSTPGNIAFAQAQTFSAGAAPISIALGDLDGDGRPEVAVTNHSADTVSVLRNTSSAGAISFASAVAFGVGDGPFGIAMGDLDGDGRRDLVVANYNAGTVSILRNTSSPGALSFAEATSSAVGTAPAAVVIGDIDGDGKRDLAVANRGSANVTLLHGSSTVGTISFDATSDISVGTISSAPRAIGLSDIDGDGKSDLAVVNEGADNVSVLRNTSSSGTVSFASASPFGVGDEPYGLAIGDLDGNGKPDLAVANHTGNNVSVLLSASSSGSINFAAAVDVTAGTTPVSAAIGDLDGDGKPDLAVANYGSSNISTLRNSPGFDASIGSNEAVGTILDDDDGTPAAPTLVLEISPGEIERGESATLTWSSDDAASCTASDAWSGAEPVRGELEVTPSAAGTYTYTLTCTNPGGSVAKSVVLTVTAPAPTIEIAVSPSSVGLGTGATLTWSSTDTTGCTASDAWSGPRPGSGSTPVTPSTVGTHTYTLSCVGPGGSEQASATLTVTAPTPSVAISVSPASIVQGTSATLRWSSSNVTNCTASNAWAGTKPLNGAIPVKPMAGTYTYALECVGEGDPASATATLTVTSPPASTTPALKFTVSPTAIAVGQSAVLAWSSAGLSNCVASGAWTGSRPVSGMATTAPSAAGTYTYTLTCQAPVGTKTLSVKLAVSATPAKPTVNLTLAPASIDVGGGSALLSWSSINASSCTASRAWTGAKALGSTEFVQPSTPGTYTYTLSCSNSAGTTVKSVVLTVTRKAPTLGFSALPSKVIVGRSFTLTWSALYANSCVASGRWTGSKVVGGTENLTAPATPGTYTYTLACTGAGGTLRKSVLLTVVPEPLPAITFAVTPTTLKSGNSATLGWAATNATSCASSGAWGVSSRTTSGTQIVSPTPVGTYTYTLACTGPGGTTTKSVKLTVTAPLPIVEFSLSPDSVFIGEPAALSWSSTHATSCSASGAWSGSKATSGSQNVSRSAVGSYTFKLACTGAGGTTTKSAVLSVVASQTYTGNFSSSGNFSASYPEYGTSCTWLDTFSGTVELVLTPGPAGTYSASVHILGTFVSTRVSGGNANFTCLNGSLTWDDTDEITGTLPGVAWTTTFTTPFGRSVSGPFTGSRSGDEITGNLPFSIDGTFVSTSAVTLTRQ